MPIIWGATRCAGAFDRLKEKGYIHARERRGYTVAYQGTLEDFEKNKAEYFAAREAGIRDLIRTAEVLLAPFLEVVPEQAGLRGETARRALNGAPFAAGALFRPPFENGLFTNLCWECLRYLRFLSFQQTKERPASGAAALRQALWADKAARGVGREELPRFITRTCEKYQLEKTEQIPFRWTVYRRRRSCAIRWRRTSSGRSSAASICPARFSPPCRKWQSGMRSPWPPPAHGGSAQCPGCGPFLPRQRHEDLHGPGPA